MLEAIERGSFPRNGFYTWNACKNCSFSHLCDKDTGLDLIREEDEEVEDVRF